MGTAFLKILLSNGTSVNLRNVFHALKNIGFDGVLPENEYDPQRSNGDFVIWASSKNDKIPDQELERFVGKKGSVLYVWQCEQCGVLGSRRAYINNQ
jgi:hypothetical protein